MGKTVLINEKSLSLIKENLNEFVVDKNSDFTNPNEFWFILYRGDLLFFTYESRGLLDAFFERHENELKKWTDKYDNSKNLYSQFEFNNFIVRFGASVPHLITGRISNSDVYINENEEYDILNSNELYQLVKEYPKYTFYLGRKEIDTNVILNNKGKGKPKFWYHGTTIGNALEILKDGLRPTPSNTIYKMKHDKTVFLTSSFETARWYANNKTKHSYGMLTNQPCVIKIDANHIDDDKIVYDYDVYNAHVVNKNDSIYNDSNLLYPNETSTIQKETDPKKYLKVGYRGVVMPSAIVSVYEVDYTRGEEYSVEDFVKKYTQESVNEAKPEVDEYEIGQESDNPPIGGNYCHVNENTSFDTSEIGGVNYSWDFDEDEYQEWLADMEYENSQETLMEYITDNVEFELEHLDNQTYHAFNREYVDYNTLEEMFGSKMQNEILKTCMNNGEGSFDVDELFSEDDVDINNQESINNIAMKLLRHGDYFKGCRGFILTNGIVVYTEMEHNEICRIPNVNDKLDFVRMGNIRILPQSIDIGARPTNEQREVLIQVINSYSDEELYLDIFEGKGSIGTKYTHPNWRFVMGEIDRYYNEGIKPQGNVQYEEKNKTILVSENQLKSIKENLDFEVNSSDIDLSSFKKKTSLAPNIWGENDILDSRIRLKLLDIADDFWKFVNLTWVKPSGIILTGSICNFNWSSFSDIDLHLIVDFDEIDEKTDFVRDYLDAKKNEWNNEHEDLKILGYPVELYVQNLDEMPQSGGIYDLEENEWVKKPSPNDIKAIGLDKFSIKDKAARIMTIIDDMYDTFSSTNDSHEIGEIGKDAQYLWKKIKAMRKQSLEERGENGIGNICYKYMRRMGYLDKLWKLRTLCYDKTNSINESKEVIKEYLEKDNNLPLYKYFKWAKEASPCDKAEDLAYNCAYYIDEYIETTFGTNPIFEELLDENGEFNYEDDSKIEEFLKILKENNLCDNFIENMECIVDYCDLPSWCTMDFERIVKNEWCIHFGSDSYSISREGFTGGTPDVDRLAYTGAGQQKHGAGYDFAFLIDDKNVDYNEYGNEAVIFRTSGVKIYHYGDNQHQVIFWGPNVKSFIPISQDNGDWVVYGHKGQVLFRGENPSDVAYWATYNLPQYRKQIMTGKNGFIPKQTVYDEHGYRKRVPYPLYRNESISNSLPLINENIDTFKLAKEHFGTTYDIRECGYILPSGEMLDFSGRHEITRPSDATHLNGRRGIDHRCIYEIGWNINKDTKLFDITMEDFIRQGAVRISPSNSWSTINLYVKPTKEQIDVISRLVRFSHGNVTVEIGDGNESLSYAEYDNAKPMRVIGEINRYFDEGINLMGNVTESCTLLKNKTIREYITYLKNSFVNEEFNADGSSNGNPYAKRWKAERQALKDFICNYGVLMQSKEDNKEGRVYKCFWDKTLSNLIGYNYCLAVQYDEVNLKPKSTIYVRACDRFTRNIRHNLQYDTRGKDNIRGTYDDNFSQNY